MHELTIDIPFPGMPGLSFHCRQAGDGVPEFLLLHGFTFNSSSWLDIMPGLAGLGRTLAYDRIPFGRSQKPLPGDWLQENPYTHDATLRQLLGVMDGAGLVRPVIVGNSAGGLLAACAALAWPDRVAALILICPAIFGGPPAVAAKLVNQRWMNGPGVSIARTIGDARWLLRRSYCNPARIDAARLRRAAVATEYDGWAHALWEFIRVSTLQPDLSRQLADIRQPVLVIAGDTDRVVAPAAQQRLVGLLPHAELCTIADAGHVPHEEQPAAVLDAVHEWLMRNGLTPHRDNVTGS